MANLDITNPGASADALRDAVSGLEVLPTGGGEALPLADIASATRFTGPTSGAIVRTLQARGEDWLSILDVIPVAEHEGIFERSSTADLSAYFNEATDHLASKGGGVLRIPSGTYIAEGVVMREGVSYVGDGNIASIIKLPATPSAHMFTSAGGPSTFDAGGWYGLQLDGGGTQTYNAIDFSSISTLEVAQIVDCFIKQFNIGYRGSGIVGGGNDRFPVIDRTRVWQNQVGLYINEHTLVGFADIRANDIGVQGRINDCQFVGTKINYNRLGLAPDGSNRLTNTTISGCMFFKNTEVALDIGPGNTVCGSYFVGVGAGSTGILINGTSNQITSNCFGLQQVGSSFANGAIVFNSPTVDRTVIAANKFICFGGPGIAAGSTTVTRLTNIGQNMFHCSNQPAIAMLNSGGNSALLISGNTVHFTGTLSGDLIEISNPGTGVVIVGNSIFSEGGSFTAALGGDLRQNSIISLNRYRSTGTGVFTDATLDNTSKVSNNYGYVTEATGTAAVASGGTSVVVTHGLARTPKVGDIYITPTNSLGNSTKYWVTSITSTQFTINVDVDPGAATATFAWKAMIL